MASVQKRFDFDWFKCVDSFVMYEKSVVVLFKGKRVSILIFIFYMIK